MKEEYEQLALDTRKDLERAVERVTADAIGTIREMAEDCGERPGIVRNRHEAYGIAAEQLAAITRAVKAIKDDTGTLLGTLADPNFPALEATSSIVNSTTEAACIILTAAAQMKRTLDNLYMAENAGDDDPTPMEQWVESAAFQEAATNDAEEDTEE